MPPIDPFHLTPEDDDGPIDRTCGRCGYDRRGLPKLRPCPECGVVPSATASGADTAEVYLSEMPDGIACAACGTPTPGLACGAMCMACAQSHISSVSDAGKSESRLPVDPTFPCPECGYDLQGTAVGRPCPECGTVLSRSRRRGTTSKFRPTILADGETSLRVTERFSRSIGYRTGLCLVFGSITITVTAGVLSMWGVPTDSYLRALIVAGVAASVAAWFVTPSTLDVEHPVFAGVRWGARVCLLGWPFGVFVEFTDGGVSWWSIGLQCVGLLGAGLLLMSLVCLANEFEMKHLARRLTTTVWLLFPIGLLTWILPFPEDTIVMPEGSFGLVATIFILIAVGPWYWMLLRTMRSVWGLLLMSSWAGRAHNDEIEQDRAMRARMNGD